MWRLPNDRRCSELNFGSDIDALCDESLRLCRVRLALSRGVLQVWMMNPMPPTT
jgi:hypothetical protein